MTVNELIKKLQALNVPNHTVIVDLHSEYTEVTSLELLTGVEKGGYVSRNYPDASGRIDIRAKGYVHIGFLDRG